MESVAYWACRFALIACQKNFVLNLVVLFFLYLFEEFVQPFEPLVARPKYHFLLWAQSVERCVNREIEFGCVVDEGVLPTLHLFALPAGYRSFIDRFGLVGHN